jgi:alcohol dehydrogenase (cytochrome c)
MRHRPLLRPWLAAGCTVLLLSGTARAGGAAQPGDVPWPTYGGSYANTRYVHLDQINPDNVHTLQLVWKYATGTYGQFETSPIVVGDTMYVTIGDTNSVVALDARTGAAKWRYTPHIGFATYIFRVNRGVAVDGGKVFIGTIDGRLIALDAETGKFRWEVKVGEPRDGFSETMAPLASKGLVYIGGAGGEFGIRGSFTAYDERDGKLVWRWWTVSPNWEGHYVTSVHGVSLNRDIAREKRDAPKYRDAWQHGGGPVWTTPALSLDTNTLYISTGNPAPDFDSTVRPGDNLYTDCIVAVDAQTGKLRWYYQETPNDVWDFDAASPPVLIEAADARGRRIPAVIEAGKTGWLYVVDRATGALLRVSHAFIPQPHIYVRKSRPGQVVQPSGDGGAIGPIAYQPDLHFAFVAGIVAPENHHGAPTGPWKPGGQAWLASGQGWVEGYHGYSTFSAIDVDDGRIAWQYAAPGPIVGGALVTGRVVFVGEEETDQFEAFDAASGKMLWRSTLSDAVVPSGNPFMARIQPMLTPLGQLWARAWRKITRQPVPNSDQDIHAPPIAYQLDGREYVAIAGDNLFGSGSDVGNTLYVFALPTAL